MIDNRLYWTPHDILTKNAMFNFVIGGRGTGKTFGSLRHYIKHYLKTGRGFIYVRRYTTNLAKRHKLLSGVSRVFPNHEFNVEGEKLMIRKAGTKKWHIMGYAMALSTADNDKSIPFDDIDGIIFDEFIIGKGMTYYIRNEVECFLDFYNTVDRYRDRVRVLFLANSISIVNPYFVYFKIVIRKSSKIKMFHDGYIAVQRLESKAFKAEVDGTRFGTLIAGTTYYDYAVSNDFRDDTPLFIAKKPASAKHSFSILFDDKMLGIWSDAKEGVYYISEKAPKNGRVYALTRSDMQPNMLMIERSNKLLRGLMRMYGQGCVYFESVKTRSFFYDVMDFLNVR